MPQKRLSPEFVVSDEESAGKVAKLDSNSAPKDHFDLGKNKRVAVSKFKGQILIDIREMYVADGTMRPGKKGICLTMEQWEALKNSMSDVDEAVRAAK